VVSVTLWNLAEFILVVQKKSKLVKRNFVVKEKYHFRRKEILADVGEFLVKPPKIPPLKLQV